MKRFLALLAALCFMAAFATPVLGDIIWEPMNNDFFDAHRAEIQSHGRNHRTEKELPIVDAPGSSKQVATLGIGEIYISHTYELDGVTWGIVEYAEQQGEPAGDVPAPSVPMSGWVSLSDMTLIYDYISFAEEHASEIYEYTGDAATLKTATNVVTWKWPNSGISDGTLLETTDIELAVISGYVDPAGREWGYISYHYGKFNSWVCLSDPANPNININANPPSGLTVPAEITPVKSGLPTWGIAAGLVVILVAGTLVLMKLLWKPQKRR